jgi:hypothetical protein
MRCLSCMDGHSDDRFHILGSNLNTTCSYLRGRKSICEWTPDQPAHLRGPGLRNIQGMPRQDWMTRKPLASQEASACRHAVSSLHHRMRWPVDSHSGVSRSANQPLTVYTVLDAIQHCLDFMRSRRSVEQANGDLSTQCAVWRGEPMRCLFPVSQDIDRLRQGARCSDYDIRLLRRQTRRRSVRLGFTGLPPTRPVTERAYQSPKRPHCRQADHRYFQLLQDDLRAPTPATSWLACFHYDVGAPDRFNQLNGCLCRQTFASRAGEVKVGFDGGAEDSRPSKQIRDLRVHIQVIISNQLQIAIPVDCAPCRPERRDSEVAQRSPTIDHGRSIVGGVNTEHSRGPFPVFSNA